MKHTRKNMQARVINHAQNLLTLALTLTLACGVHAANWNGNAGTYQWNDAGNWSGNPNTETVYMNGGTDTTNPAVIGIGTTATPASLMMGQ